MFNLERNGLFFEIAIAKFRMLNLTLVLYISTVGCIYYDQRLFLTTTNIFTEELCFVCTYLLLW